MISPTQLMSCWKSAGICQKSPNGSSNTPRTGAAVEDDSAADSDEVNVWLSTSCKYQSASTMSTAESSTVRTHEVAVSTSVERGLDGTRKDGRGGEREGSED